MALSVIFGIFVLRLRHDQKFQPIFTFSCEFRLKQLFSILKVKNKQALTINAKTWNFSRFVA